MLRSTQVLIWRIFALTCLALGLIGLALPVVPTTPFLIVAAWAGGKGWPALEEWLLNNPIYGPHIRQWRTHGAVPRNAKWIASTMMVVSGGGVQFTELPLWLRIGVPLCLLAAGVWLWRRPEPAAKRVEE